VRGGAAVCGEEMVGHRSTRMLASSGEPCVNIFVGTLACTTTEQDLRQRFELYGTVATMRNDDRP
jgi:hypothetical protein